MELVDYFRRRWDRLAPPDVRDYPWWLPLGTALAVVAAAVAAIVQHVDSTPPVLLALAGVLVLADAVAGQIGTLLPWPLAVICTAGGVGILLAYPVTTDLAPVLLIISVAKITSTHGPWSGLTADVVYLGVLVTAAATVGLWGFGVYVVGVLLGFDVGFTMRWQLRALMSERARLAAEREGAAAAERQRIAREIHDLVAHSLSVTMLHVTGARHALVSDGDVAEAADALREAEQVGRQTMAEIRRTVGMLSTPGAGTAALPGVPDIDDLVTTVRAAGLQVSYERLGGAGAVAPALGLGLYRVAQESLSNIAKHAPSSPATVRLEVLPDGAHLQVRNPLPPDAVPGRGAGLPGMVERARQLGGRLTAGPEQREWRVEFVVPAEVGATHECLLSRLRSAGAR